MDHLRPLPCGLDASLDSVCVSSPDEKVEVLNKIGAFLHLSLPHSASIERLHFDFADSLLEWVLPAKQEELVRSPSKWMPKTRLLCLPILRNLNQNEWANGVIKLENITLIG